jgi:hypothetical protein
VPPPLYSFYVQQGNGQVLVSWAQGVGAVSYNVLRSVDGIVFVQIANVTAFQYLDTTVVPGTQYYYQAQGVSSTAVFGPPTIAQSVVPATSGNLSLGAIRLAAFQRADRVNSQFVTLPEANFFINQSLYELYDLLITSYEDYYIAAPAYFTTTNATYYPIPDGVTTFYHADGTPFVPPPLFKLTGIDLGISSVPQGFASLRKFNFLDRNKYFFPNTASTLFGIFNLEYRMLGERLELIPQPSANQPMRIWYIPRLKTLLADSDIADGVSGWIQYVIIRTAKFILDKEESDTSTLTEELGFLKQRIESAAVNRDVGMPDTITDVRGNSGYFGGPGNGIGNAGW